MPFEAEIIDSAFYVSHPDEKKYIYIPIYLHAFLHISVQLEGGSILTAEMLVKAISRGKRSICGKAGRKTISRGKHSNC